MTAFTFFLPVKMEFGRDKYKALSNYLKGDRVMIISDPIISKMLYYEEIKNLLGEKLVLTYEKVMPNPETGMIDEAVSQARASNIDCVLGIGGGSSLDTAKVVALLAGTKEGEVKDFLYQKCEYPACRTELLLMPTTAGTGSEVTNVAVVNDIEAGMKKPLVSPYMYADIALIDSALTDTMPKKVTAGTGFDAFCHAIEAYWATNTNPITQATALEAMDLILKNLKKAYDDGADQEARNNMAKASMLAGIAFSQTRTTVLHAISYYLTAHYRIEHGIACTFTLVPFMKYNLETIREALQKAASYCGYQTPEEFIGAISKLYSDVNMPKKLSEYGVQFKEVDRIVEEGMAQGTTKLNPRLVTFEEMKKIIIGIV